MKRSKRHRQIATTIWLVIITVVVDMLGFGVAFPIIPVLMEQEFLGTSIPAHRFELVFGLLLAVFAIAQFVGAPILGALSDRYGRKRLLLLSVFGTQIGLLIFTIGIVQLNLDLLFIGRTIQGLFGGNIAICYSVIADVNTPKTKVRNFGLVGVAFGIGIIMGAVLGGFLSDPGIVPWFNFQFPFWLLLGTGILNLLGIYFWFHETLRRPSETPVSIFTGVRNMVKAFTIPRLSILFWVNTVNAFAFAFFTHLIPLYVIAKFGFDQSTIAYFFGYVGIWGIITQGALVDWISRKFSESFVVLIASVILIAAYSLLLVPTREQELYFVVPLLAIGHGLYLSNISALLSNLSSRKIQGEILGIQQSLHSFSNALPPIIGGALILKFGVAFPIYLSIGCAVLALLIYLYFYAKYRHHRI